MVHGGFHDSHLLDWRYHVCGVVLLSARGAFEAGGFLMDIVYIGLTLALVAISIGLIKLCERL